MSRGGTFVTDVESAWSHSDLKRLYLREESGVQLTCGLNLLQSQLCPGSAIS